ncbi:Disease resistance protein (CC-NBS-LRR class) family [Euphorbia peplus]|nr:Disease resistance protein (CC-NBS-LRR class) family [Euphorbia peplus]
MGNICSIQCGDALLGRCWDCTARQALYICQIEDNLEALQTAKDELQALRNDVDRAATNQVDTPDMVRMEQVGGWISQVDILIPQVTTLIVEGEEEKQKLCIAGCCSKNCKSSYIFGKRLAKGLKQVLDLKTNGVAFKVLVMQEPTRKIQSDLETLKTTREQLLALKEEVQQRIDLEEGPERERLRLVTLWLSMVETTLVEADELITEGPQQVRNFRQGDISNYTFIGNVANKLRAIVNLKSQGDFDEVVARAPSEPDFIRMLQDDLRVLAIKKEELRALKEDVAERVRLEEGRQQKPLQQVQLWLLKAGETVKEAGELGEQAPEEMEKFCLKNFSNKMFRPNVDRLLNDAIVLIATGNFRQVVGRALPEPVHERSQEPSVGTGAMLEAAWNCLLYDSVSILGICGIGGVGKTTLLTEINNKFANTPSDFDIVTFVVVSRDFKLEKIQEDIWKHIGFCDREWLDKSSDEKANNISYVMQRKKFALLLDDVWRQFNIRDVGVPAPNALQNGSKVVITARSSQVCTDMGAKRMINVKPLSPIDAWDLFREKVGDIDPDNLLLSQQVASECCGLPIALVTIGRTMASRTSTEEWEHALGVLQRSSSNSQGMVDEIDQGIEVHVFKRLKFSYDCLPNKIIRSCFLYCSLFPEDFKILKNDLVHYWTCENFCSLAGGHIIVGTLIQQCLLEEEEGRYVKMHDVIRDMALWIACECKEEKEEKYIVRAGSQLTEVPDIGEWKGATRVSLMGNSFNNFQAMGNTCDDVVTLFLSHNPNLRNISEAVFPCKDKLKVLDLSETTIRELPLGISELGLLQYLNLSHTRISQLPMELNRLIKLKYLNLDNTGFLVMIPPLLLSSFSKLQVLKMFLCGSMSCDPDNGSILNLSNLLIQELLSLKNLVELSITIKSAYDLHSFCKEPRLLNCTRALVLQQLKASDLNISPLVTAKHLNRLLMIGNLSVTELVAVHSDRLTNNQLISSSLEEVVVSNHNGMLDLTWVILAQNLTILRVTFNNNIKAIVSPAKLGELQAADGSSNFFSKLQTLDLYGLPKLETIYCEALSFPSLKQIDVYDCPQLKKLPLNSKSATGCKVVIKGEVSWWNNLEWEDDAARDAFSFCFQEI